MNNKAYHSKKSEADNSQTPWWLIRQIQEVANVDIIHDVCAKDNSKKADSYWSESDNALNIDWSQKFFYMNANYEQVNAFWMNPPFSLAKEFTTKAADEARKGVVTIGCVKHAPDADWFQEMEKRATFIYVPDGRIQFLTHDGKPFMRFDKKQNKWVKSGANFPLCFPLWTPFTNDGKAVQVRFKRDQKGFE